MDTLASFDGTHGANPQGRLLLSGNTLYGTTSTGAGIVFSVPTTGGSVTTLASFAGTNGADPIGGLVLAGNTLYGTAEVGGPNGKGVVFSAPTTGGAPTVLASFNGSNGANPGGALAVANGTLYGTTSFGGAGTPASGNGFGTVFSLPVTGGSPTVLASFGVAGANGGSSYATPTVAGNTIYGTTLAGGTGNVGTVFSLPLTGGVPTTLASFNISSAYPGGDLLLVGSTLYGTTTGGQVVGGGTVFSLPVTGGKPTLLATLPGFAGNYVRAAGLVLIGGTLYGTTANNGSTTVYSVPVAGGTPTVVSSFPGHPYAGLTASGSTLYGTTYDGGTNGLGSVFALTRSAVSLTVSSTAPVSFGSNRGTLALSGSPTSTNGVTAATFAATPTGYVSVTGLSPGVQTYALAVADSDRPALPSDLALLVSQINATTFPVGGLVVAASTADPTGGAFTPVAPAGGYDLYLTVTNSSATGPADDFGFDLTELSGGTGTLTASAVAVDAVVSTVPEPTAVAAAAAAAGGLLTRRRPARVAG